MTIASFFLGMVIASIFGCAFHFWRGGGLKWLLFYNLCAWIGFWAGHFLGKWSKIIIIQAGPINLGPAILGSLIFIFLGYWLSMASQEKQKR